MKNYHQLLKLCGDILKLEQESSIKGKRTLETAQNIRVKIMELKNLATPAKRDLLPRTVKKEVQFTSTYHQDTLFPIQELKSL